MAKAVIKILTPSGMRLPNKDNIPNANAISVAIGMPKPS